ncbi:Uncharacterised protein [Mycobacteroides abscessus subsp. massiliense]|nr:Uncharacterised protein [Mycobacteroides abscessus subsp. massiliense]SKQ16851.1 Uncharacterised protein [Mycobacteroides abscessus subsp. massiliense]
MKIDPVATEKCAAQLDATDTHVEFAKGKLRATEGKDLGDLTDAMNAARNRVSGALGTVSAVQKEIRRTSVRAPRRLSRWISAMRAISAMPESSSRCSARPGVR